MSNRVNCRRRRKRQTLLSFSAITDSSLGVHDYVLCIFCDFEFLRVFSSGGKTYPEAIYKTSSLRSVSVTMLCLKQESEDFSKREINFQPPAGFTISVV